MLRIQPSCCHHYFLRRSRHQVFACWHRCQFQQDGHTVLALEVAFGKMLLIGRKSSPIGKIGSDTSSNIVLPFTQHNTCCLMPFDWRFVEHSKTHIERVASKKVLWRQPTAVETLLCMASLAHRAVLNRLDTTRSGLFICSPSYSFSVECWNVGFMQP